MRFMAMLRGRRRLASMLAAMGVAVALAAVASGDSAIEPNHTYRAAVAQDAPSALFAFDDDASATALHDDGAAATASDAQAHGVTPSAPGPFAGAHAGTFDGSGDVDLATNPVDGATAFTLEAWIERDVHAGDDEPVLDIGSSAGSHFTLTPAAGADGHPLRFTIVAAGATAQVDAPTLAPGAWHHVAVTESGGTLTLYVDGVQAGSTTGVTLTPADVAAATTARLGASIDGSVHLHGALSDVAFYRIALDATAIKAHYDAAELPVVVSAPGAAGTARDGESLTADHGTWSGASTISYTYQWQRGAADGTGFADVVGATAADYAVGADDVGSTLRVVVTAINGSGTTVAPSAPTALVVPRAPDVTAAPSVAGTAKDGATLTADHGGWTGTAPISYTYQWQRGAADGASFGDVDGATAAHYAVGADDVGHTLRVVVTATNAGGASAAPSAATDTVAGVAPTATSAPTLTGDAGRGQTLTADHGAWTGTAPITYTYQWRACDAAGRDCADLAGATARTYAPAAAAVGHTLRVAVTASNAAGTAAAASSPSTVVTAAAPLVARPAQPSATGFQRLGALDDASCTITWTGAGTNAYWSNGANWSTGVAPAASDTACAGSDTTIEVNGGDGTAGRLLDDGTLNVTGSALTLAGLDALNPTADPSSVASLSITGGSLTGAGAVTVTGTLAIGGGQLTGSGTTVVAAGATAVASSCPQYWCSMTDSQRTLRNEGTFTVSSGTFTLADAAVLQNEGTLEVGPDGGGYASLAGDGDTAIDNDGTLRSRGSDGANAMVGAPLDNAGTVRAVDATSLTLSGGSTGPASAGTFTATGSGAVHFQSNTYHLGDATLSGDVVIDGATVDTDGDVVQHDALSLAGGTVAGDGTLQVYGDAVWSGGGLQGSGRTVVHTGASLQATTCTQYWCVLHDQTRALDVVGALRLTGGTIGLSDNATLTNSGTFAIGDEGGDYTSLENDGGGSLVSTGSVVTRGEGTSYLGVPIDNEGSVTAADGTRLQVQGGEAGSAAQTGSWATSGSGELHFTSGSYTLGDASVAGGVFFDGATIETAGTLDQTGTLHLAGSTVTGAGTLRVHDQMLWSGGTLRGTGQTTVLNGATLQLSCGCSLQDDQRSLVNQGTLRQTGGTFQLFDGASVTNAGTFAIGDDGGSYASFENDGGGSLVNTGTLTTRASGTVYEGVPIDNEGTVTAADGTRLQVQGGQSGSAAQTGTWATSGSGELHFTSNAYKFGDTSVAGNVYFDGATIETAGTLDETDTLHLTGGTVTGAGTLRLHDDLVWTGGALRGTGQTTVLDGATLELACGCSLQDDQRALLNQGTLRQTGGTFQLFNGATVNSSGTLLMTSDGGGYASFENDGGGSFVNTGSFTAHGSGTIYEGVPIDNEGTVTAADGTRLQVQGGQSGSAAQTGTWATSGSGELHFTTNAYKFGDTSVAGGIYFDGGTIETAGTLDQTGTLHLAGSTVTGAGTLRLHDQTVWTSGSLQGTGQTTILSGATLQASTCTPYWCGLQDIQRALVNQGSLRLTDGFMSMNDDAVLTNSGTFTMGDDDGNSTSIEASDGGAVVNDGTFVTRGDGTEYLSAPFDDEGSVTVIDGTKLYVQGGGVGAIAQTGSWATSSTGELHFNANTLGFGTGTTWSGNVFADGATIQTLGTVQQSGSLALAGSTITGAGTLRISGTATWTSGTESGTGSTVIAPSGELDASTCTQYWCGLNVDQRLLHNEGAIRVLGGFINLGNDAAVHNDAGASFAIGNDGGDYTGVYLNGGNATFLNQGEVTTRGTGTTQFSVPFENEGGVSVVDGTQAILWGGTPGGDLGLGGSVFGAIGGTANGSWTTHGTGAVHFTGGTFLLGSGAAFAGTERIESGVTVVVPYLAGAGARVDVDGGTLAVSDPNVTTSTVKDLNLLNGVVTGPGELHVAEALNWSGGRMTGPGRTTLNSGGEGLIQAGGNTIALDGRILENDGHVTFTSGYFEGDDDGLIQNKGTFDANADETNGSGGFYQGGGNGGIVYNEGLFEKTAGTGTTQVNWAYNDAGRTVAHTGRFNFAGPRAQVTPGDSEQRGPGNAAAPNVQRSCSGDPVDCATGNQFEVQTDVSVPGRGLGLELTRTYNSQAAAADGAVQGTLGYGWTSTYSDHLAIDANSGLAIVTQADGSVAQFIITPSGTFQAPAWIQATLVAEGDGTYQYTLPSGEVHAFGSDGRLLWESDRNGNHTTMSYDGSGRLDEVTDAGGRALDLAYNGDGTLASVTDPAGKEIDYTYSGGELTGVAMAGVSGPAQWGFGYDAAHQLTSLTDADGHTTTTGYDASHRATTQTDAAGRTRTWAYDGDTTTITNPAGDVTREVFAHGEPVTITRAYGTADAATQTITYDAKFQPVASEDAAGHTTSYTYDNAGNRTSATDPDGHTTHWTYDTEHDVLTVQTPMGKTTTFDYDGAGNLTAQHRALDVDGGADVIQSTSYGHDAAGDLTTVTDPLGHVTTLTYDARGDLASATDPRSGETTWTYDDDSRTASITSPRGHVTGADPTDDTTTFTRDARGRLTQTTDPLGHHTASTYDGVGNVTSDTDGDGRTISYAYDAVDEPTSTTYPGGATASTSYDDDGQVTSTTDENGHTTTYSLDPLSRVASITDPDDRTTSYAYDDAGERTGQTDPDGHSIDYTYDGAGDLTGVDYQDSGTHDLGFAYDGDGRRTSMTDASGTTSYAYDSLGRMTSSTDGAGKTVSYAYDLADRQTRLTYPGGDAVDRTYDDDDQLTSITDWLGNTTTYDRDPDGELTTIGYPSATGDVDHWSYDQAGNPTGIALEHSGTSRATLDYSYNNSDQVLSETATGTITGAHSYDYDPRGRLSTQDTTALTYDPAGNLTSVGGAAQGYDAADQVTSRADAAGTTTYDYNLEGDRVTTTPASGSATHYDYDRADEMTAVRQTGQPTVAYGYDADGLRVSKTKGTATSQLTWDRSSDEPDLLVDGSTRYVYDDDGLPMEQVDAAGDVTFLHHDRLGSIRETTSATGAEQATYDYDATGRRTTTSGTADMPFGFTGQYTDPDTGLVYLRARDYDPVTGQFLTRDPLVDVTRQPYAYAGGDPADNVDPGGMLFLKKLWGASKVVMTRGLEGGLGEADGITSVLTLGHVTVSGVLGIDTSCLGPSYGIGRPFGTGVGLAVPLDRALDAANFLKKGWEIKIGDDVRIAPGGNRTGHPTGRFPHYHRRVIDPETGEPVPGQGIKRHRPWDTKSTDTSFRDRF